MASMSVHFLDVGMGDGTLVQMRPGNDPKVPAELALVDFGEKRTESKVPYKDAMKYLVEFVDANSRARAQPTPFIDTLFITHPDGDHYNKVVELTKQAYPSFPGEQLRFGRIVYGGNEADYGTVIKNLWDGGLGLVDKKPLPLGDKQHAANAAAVPVPDWTFVGGDVRVYLLSCNYPRRNAGPPNPRSLVLMFEVGDKKLILQGDAEKDVEKFVVDTFEPSFLKATALKLGHHGGKEATSVRWVNAVKPKTVFASGDFRWAHPYCEPICRVIEEGCLQRGMPGFPVWYCCGSGHRDNRQYFNNPTTEGICLNLWYVAKQAPDETLNYGDQIGGRVAGQYQQGTVFGVQWLLYLPDKGDVQYGVTLNAVPNAGVVPAPFDCAAAAAAAALELELAE
jgi:hypothetical protein